MVPWGAIRCDSACRGGVGTACRPGSHARSSACLRQFCARIRRCLRLYSRAATQVRCAAYQGGGRCKLFAHRGKKRACFAALGRQCAPEGRAREGVLCAPMAPAGVRVELWDVKILNQTGRLSRGKPTPGRRSVSPRSPTEPPGTAPSPPAQNHPPHANDKTTNLLRRLRPLHHVIHTTMSGQPPEEHRRPQLPHARVLFFPDPELQRLQIRNSFALG